MNAGARMTRGMIEPGEASPGNDMVDLLGLFRVLWRRKLLIAAVVALGTVGAYLYGKNLTPTYTAKAAVLIDPQQTQILELKAMLSGISTDGAGARHPDPADPVADLPRPGHGRARPVRGSRFQPGAAAEGRSRSSRSR